MKRQRRHNNGGFTLLELMFASGVLALGLAMLFGALISINALGQISEERTTATAQVASVLEHIRTQDFDDLLNYELPYLPSGPGVERAIVVECFDEDGGAVQLPMAQAAEDTGVTPSFPNPLEVKVTMVWASDTGRPYSVSATTLVGR